ncbi:MAG: IS1634 family transposase [Solirubrobacterales bacterium]|nr:MAG: IS1634 family transposase [Solirubrobacterales bacterium]
MYVKRHAVVRGRKRYVYLRLVQAYRDEHGRVRHRVLRTLGREDELKASGQLEQLMGSFARLDPPPFGVRREVGALLLAWHFITELDLVATVDRLLPQRGRQQLSAGEVCAALILSRLCSPSPLYDIAGWASGTALLELAGIPPALLNDDRLGRALETLAVHAEPLRGALAARAIERFGIDAGRLHVDLTALRVAGAYEDSALVAKGWAQGEGVARQVRALQATSACGVSLYVRPDPGNAAEVALIGASLERLQQITGTGLIICDAACGYPKTLAQIARSGLEFIVPLRASTGFRERYLKEVGPAALRALGYVAERQRDLPKALRTRYRGALRDWQITDPETGEPVALRVAYIHSSEEAREVAAARERALTKAEAALARVKRGLGGRHYKTRRQVDTRIAKILTGPLAGLIQTKTATRAGKPTLTFQRDHDAIARAARTDGVYALATNLTGRLSARRVLELYKDQHVVERRHRDYKQTLKVRPIFLHNDDRIYALTSIVGLALLVFGLIESQLRQALDGQLLDLLPEGRAAKPTGRSILAAFQGLGLTYTHNGIHLDRLTYTQRRILELLDIQPPWPEQDHALTSRGKHG